MCKLILLFPQAVCQIRKDACGGDADKSYDIMKQLANMLATTDLAHRELYNKRDELLTKGGWPLPGPGRRKGSGRGSGSDAQKEGEKPKAEEVIEVGTPEKPQDKTDDEPLAKQPDEKPVEAKKPYEKPEVPKEAPQSFKPPCEPEAPKKKGAGKGDAKGKDADAGKDDAKGDDKQV